jgi:hypothetical protein
MKATLALVLSSLMAVATGCGSSSSNGSGSQASLIGSWSITTTDGVNGDFSGTIQATLIANNTCVVEVPTASGGFGISTQQGTSCAIADDQGDGSISGTGDFFYPPVGLMVGETGNQLNLIFVEGIMSGYSYAVFNATGTIGNGTMSGSWTCDFGPPNCTGLSGTFTGAKI